MITGRDALFSVERAITQVRAHESQLDGALRSAMAEAERLRGAEAEGFRMLARIKLDAMARDQVIGDIDATERRALGMIQKHRQTLEALARRRDEVQAALDQAEAARHDRNQDLALAIDALDQLRARTAERVKAVATWQAAKAAVEAAEKVAANADQKAAHAESDLAAKGKPYEDDPLFMYLWRKKHGQAEDTSNYLVRFFDRKVALLVGYQGRARELRHAAGDPGAPARTCQGKQADLDAAKAQLADVERRALVADGVEAAEARVESGDAAMKAAEEAVATATAELQQIDADHERALGSGEDTAYGGAVDLLVQGLKREDLRQLYQEALRTPAKEDEQAIEAISQARAALQKADAEVGQIRAQIREQAQRRGELEGARDRARRVGFDNPSGTFGGQADIAGDDRRHSCRGLARHRSRSRLARQLSPPAAARRSRFRWRAGRLLAGSILAGAGKRHSIMGRCPGPVAVAPTMTRAGARVGGFDARSWLLSNR